MSVDGYVDDTTPERLRLSDEEDFDRVDQVRAEERQTRGLSACPLKVVVTASGDISPDLRFFHSAGDRLIYCPETVAPKLRDRIGDLAEVASIGASLDFGAMVDDLGERGIRQLMVEGGTTIHTQFLTADLADEIHLAVAPFFVGDADDDGSCCPATSRTATPGECISQSCGGSETSHSCATCPRSRPQRRTPR